MTLTLTATTDLGFDAALDATRRHLADQGFGIITEIDLAATLATKIGVQVPRQTILGACRPELAHRAIEADPVVATMLPCNVVVRQDGDGVVVEAFDPAAMEQLVESDALASVATEARTRLRAALDAVAADDQDRKRDTRTEEI